MQKGNRPLVGTHNVVAVRLRCKSLHHSSRIEKKAHMNKLLRSKAINLFKAKITNQVMTKRSSSQAVDQIYYFLTIFKL